MLLSTQVKTHTRQQHLNNLLARQLPACTSPEYRQEHFKILCMLRLLSDMHPKDARALWMINLLSEALEKLHSLDDPTSSPTDSFRKDNGRWTEVLVRRMMAELLWEHAGTVESHDIYETLKEGRTKAASVRLHEQVRRSWEAITGADLSTEFSIQV
ncbi:hypothetical protein CLAFUW4_09147 [Fulvia fulva]|uniref:Uncharacterized protein n=1 Tax=Passalora fulva TaxID=5499 RepID=A0A9Q8PG06_PASFU|nr:uncharacterized protein CLAFUR5_09258 [Fulvia fulva]KAK4613312.1 hypothetical protein CLAFUR4_09153 [Fulvia fulva]KAK4615203.1 hypothetical protein CLAFUR0_09145 [Fulvia fulva]UJO21727.1 hypothetical protein CLAFUR5_09258 [Fulvia fulva]WPV20432.1 hypothetical protein CLAFUW4_09147 [Fulvia fulva]WPV35501.1 hypothetical protein CLAFUW7_09148 [Fulvia fulva]